MNYVKALSTFNIHHPLNEETLRKEYRRLAQQYHPDKYQTYQEQIWASNRFIKLHEAYQFLLRYQNEPVSYPPADGADESHTVQQPQVPAEEEPSWVLSSLFQMVSSAYDKVLLCMGSASPTAYVSGYLLMGVGIVSAIALLPYIHLGFLFVYLLVVYSKVQRAFLTVASRLLKQPIRPDIRTVTGQVTYLSIITLLAYPIVYIAYQVACRQPLPQAFFGLSFSTFDLFMLAMGGLIFLVTAYEWLTALYAWWLNFRLRHNLREVSITHYNG